MCILSILVLSCPLFGQTVGQIKNDPGYLYGEGGGHSFKSADYAAVGDLIGKISGELPIRVMDTYRGRVADISDRIVVKNEPDAQVFRYLKRQDVPLIFDYRKEKVLEMVEFAQSAEAKLQIDDALRYLYWADVLSRSLINRDDITFKDRFGNNQSLSYWLSLKIQSVLNGISIEFPQGKNINNGVLEVFFLYRGEPVSSLDYTYFDGRDWSDLFSARDGLGVILVRDGVQVDDIKLKYEYSYSDMVHIHKEVSEVAAVIPELEYFGGQTELITHQRGDIPYFDLYADSHNTSGFMAVENSSEYESVLSLICSAISNKDYSSVKDSFTPEGWDVFSRLIGYGNARLLEGGSIYTYGFGGDVWCRSIPMVFSFQNNDRTFVEKVVFTFNRNKKVTNVSFALSDAAAEDIISKTIWSEEARMILISFLENYKTAYALKRLDYISSIFDEDALIITGRVLNRTGARGEFGKNKYVELTRLNKEQYIRNLSYCFKSKEFINIRFEDNEVIKMGKGGEMFGIQIKQDYYSSNYADSGYLFLMVDLNDSKKPMIHVRTWQEEPDKDFGIIGPYHF